MDYSRVLSPEILKAAGLEVADVEVSISLSWHLGEAVKVRRAELRKDVSSPKGPEQQQREQAEDEQLFIGAAIFLSQRMKR